MFFPLAKVSLKSKHVYVCNSLPNYVTKQRTVDVFSELELLRMWNEPSPIMEGYLNG